MEALRRALTELTAALEAEGKAKLSADNAMANYSDGGRREVAAYEAALLRVVEAMRLARAALSEGQAPEPVAQEPGRSDSAPGLFQAAAEWLAQYAGEIQASHYMPAQNRWDDEAAHRDFDGLRETAKALDAAQGQWDALVRERNRISALHAESQREIDRLYPAGMDAARAKAIERPINALLEGPAGLYGTGDARHPDKLVPVYKNSSGQVWSMTLDAVLRPDGWHADAVVYGGPIAPPCWSLATKGAEK